VEKNGKARHLKLSDFRIEPLATWRSPRSGGVYPSRWRLRLPAEGIELQVAPLMADQELNTQRGAPFDYWEGAVDVRGTQRGRTVKGQGYVELTGYARPMGGTF
jgi:predicted secreted hydrolase